MNRTRLLLLGTGLGAAALTLACGGGGATATPAVPAQGTVGFITTDAATESWSNVGIIIRKASLVLASDTSAASPVVIYDGSRDTTPVNLLQEDQVDELLSHATGVPAGTYDRLIVEVDGSPANITLVPAADPATGAVPPAIDPSLIKVRGTADPAQPTWMVLPTITLASPVVVTANATTAVAVDFDLSHPAFIATHDVPTAAGGQTLYVVNFGTRGIFRHRPAAALTAYYLRRHLGTVASVAADGSSFTMLTEHGQTLRILADKGANPTLFHNLDAKPVTAVAASSVPATLAAGLQVECTARYQADGSLTAVRVWYSATANLPAWRPEGHITFVDRANNLIRVLDSAGNPRTFLVNAATRWYFKGDVSTDLSGGDGSAFLSQVERYFKVHLTVADPTASPMTATSVDIQRGVFEGSVGPATASGFTYTRTFGDLATATHALGYGASFSSWDFTFPGLATTGTAGFLAEANSGIVLDTSGTPFKPYGISTLDWSSGWNAANAVFMPIGISPFAQTVTGAFAAGSLQITARGASAVPVTVTLDATAQEQPLVTTFTRQAGAAVTVATVDSSQWASVLTAGAKVRVFGVPDGTGKLKAYYVNIYR
ncbi:DUF4382 domain-containing protein [Mesoterricola silvestris]|uniref:DUF4382 domain-containing protein n=1 Tax=Mesoterricola silvestris TaxID=2927979 RepID=A0AA48GH80_9BACT|nr:DUF4382 domain-containing protein [Mesoterricola silvestris]BDU71172.1 hypothetical protein METEAL_03460 [Mesoterricola silvestris]